MRDTCELNVLSDCSRLCSSPMSARTSWKIGRLLPCPAGMCMPDWAIRLRRPTVLSAYGLAAGVGAGDDEQAKGETKTEVDGHHHTRTRGDRGFRVVVGSFLVRRVDRLDRIVRPSGLVAKEVLQQGMTRPGAARGGRRC